MIAQVAFGRGLILPVMVPLVGFGVALTGTLVVHYLTASVERAQTRDLFSRFVPDSVVAQVLERADTEDDVRLGGELLTAPCCSATSGASRASPRAASRPR